MARQKVLVPYNFTLHDQKAIQFIIRTFAQNRDIEFTLFHAYIPLPEIETESNAVLGKLKGTMLSLATELRKQESFLKGANKKLQDNGFSDDQLDYVFKPMDKEIPYEIAEKTLMDKYDLVILNRKPGRISRLFGKSISGKVLSILNDTAVCIIS